MSSGYILQNTQDTIRGFVRSEKSGQIEFKSGDDDFEVFQSSDLVGYGMLEDHYRSKIVNGKTQFLKILISGKGSLYVQKNDIYLENGDVLSLLERESYQYIGTLNAALNDCESIRSVISSLEYGEKHFINLLIDYNECVGSKYILPSQYAAIKEEGYLEGERLNFFCLVSGYNDQILGLGAETVFSKYLGTRIRVGFGGLRAKFSGGIKIGNQYKSAFNLGITPAYYAGLQEVSADFEQGRSATLKLKPITVVQLTGIYNWKLSGGKSLFFETGYVLAFKKDFYSIVRPPRIGSNKLSDSEIDQLNSLRQSGLVASFGLLFKL